ncbi:MAG TPA: AAA family ATPase [Blastocatellia bacterium]|nr:AAA family ATPase [Blastocatellia bacterium]
MLFSNYLKQALREQVVGHEYAITSVTRAVTLALSRRRELHHPLVTLLFIGPSGSGKTHLARALARTLLGSERKLIYINCPQLSQSAHPITDLYEQLVAGARNAQLAPPCWPQPFSILIFEKIDKASPAFRDQLAAALSRAELYVRGCPVSLDNTFVILTSDLSQKLTDQLIGRTIGFFRNDGNEAEEPPRQQQLVLEEFDHLLGDYLVNRIDDIIIFESLTGQNVITLLEQQLAGVEQQLAGSGIGLLVEPEVKTFLLRHSLEDLTHGMRQIKRIVRNYLEFPLADLILSGLIAPGATVVARYEPPRNFLHFHILIPRLSPAYSLLTTPYEPAAVG